MDEASKVGGLADPKLLETIDKLFEYNIGKYVDLPQLIVVGDQSSGKSSVLEGLIGFAFPRNSGLCTRFCTQIVFRRGPASKISVSILAHDDAAKDRKEKMSAWHYDDVQEMTPARFGKILQEVHDLMDLGDLTQQGKQTFSNDVLKIEICDPSQEHLSVIDIPGIFKKTTKGLTTKSDMAMVRGMVTKYMNNRRSVILAVVPANVDIATQEILDMAEICDEKGQRTLGVLTKPDLVDKGAEQPVIDLIEDRSHRLNLGWHIVRNLGQSQLEEASTNRYDVEKTFFESQQPWSQLDKDKVGIKALEVRLREILAELVRREFPVVQQEINHRLKVCREKLVDLGPPRATQEHQHSYLLRIATEFQSITSCALKAQYGEYEAFERDGWLELATHIVGRNAVFSSDVAQRGHMLKFADASTKKKEIEDAETEMSVPKFPEWAKGRSLCDRYFLAELGDLEYLLPIPITVGTPAETEIIPWLRAMYKSTRGFELGSFDTSLLPLLLKKQSANWDNIALGYICDIVTLVHNYIKALIGHCCHDDRVRKGLDALLMDPLYERYKKAVDHVKFVLQVERAGTPLTNNHYFADNLEKCRQKRLKSALVNSNNVQNIPGTGDVVKIQDFVKHQSNSNNLDFVVHDLHDILSAYYKVARKRFVDVVCMQGTDYHLIAGPDTPLKVFTPEFVSSLGREQLESIAGEDLSTRRKRKELRNEIANLEKGRKVLV